MDGAKSLVVLCFLLVIASSQAAPCKVSVCYRVCRGVGLGKQSCAKNCHCSLPHTFVPNELGRKVMMTEVQPATEMEDDYNRAEAVLEEMMMMMEELISPNDKLAPKCKYNVCYRACRAVGGTKQWCSNKCNCRQLVRVALAEGTDMKDVDDEASIHSSH